MYVTLDHCADTAADVRTFWFRPERPFRYIAGQFVEVSLPHDNEDSRGHTRWFTLSSSPHEPLLALTTRFTQDGSSFKQALAALTPGTQILFSEPLGDFVLPKDQTIPLVFVGVGLGVTPVQSITSWLAQTGEHRDITVIHAARHESDLAFRRQLEQHHGPAYLPVLSQPASDWTGRSGRLHAKMVLGNSKPTDRTMFYLSGPEAVITTIEKGLHHAGVDPYRIITDYFPGYPDNPTT